MERNRNGRCPRDPRRTVPPGARKIVSIAGFDVEKHFSVYVFQIIGCLCRGSATAAPSPSHNFVFAFWPFLRPLPSLPPFPFLVFPQSLARGQRHQSLPLQRGDGVAAAVPRARVFLPGAKTHLPGTGVFSKTDI